MHHLDQNEQTYQLSEGEETLLICLAVDVKGRVSNRSSIKQGLFSL